MITALFFCSAAFFLALGHFLKALRWHSFVRIYEDTPLSVLVGSLAGGYLINFFVPFHLGDVFRIWMSGRRMENRYGYAAATIIVDRCLDLLAVGVILAGMWAAMPSESLLREMVGYLVLIAAMVLVFVIVSIFHRACKRMALSVASVFNDSIKLWLLFFLWSLISSFKDVYRKLNKKWLLLQTIAMWGSYLLSYSCVAAFLSTQQQSLGLVDVFLKIFQSGALGQSTFAVTSGMFAPVSELLLCLYILIPLPVMIGIAAAISRKRGSLRAPRTMRILPQLHGDEQLRFLDVYFTSSQRQSVREYLEMNHDVCILQDYSSGSDATTMLCVKDNETIFRKYAFGKAADKLEVQARWLKRYADKLPLTVVRAEKRSAVAYCYDMAYQNRAVGFFQFVNTQPVEKSWEILRTMLDDLEQRLYRNASAPLEKQDILTYIDSKVTGNLEAIQKNRTLKGLMEHPYLTINGVRYRNLPLLMYMLGREHLCKVFAGDIRTEIHGDLTVENIICCPEGEGGKPYYLIDPNPTDLASTKNMDYAKLLQSLHGKYELLKLSPSLEIVGDRVSFFLPDTGQYRQIYERYHDWLTTHFDRNTVRSIYYHEIIHWLRLLPYRIRRNESTAACYYAALILVMNDIEQLFGEDKR